MPFRHYQRRLEDCLYRRSTASTSVVSREGGGIHDVRNSARFGNGDSTNVIISAERRYTTLTSLLMSPFLKSLSFGIKNLGRSKPRTAVRNSDGTTEKHLDLRTTELNLKPATLAKSVLGNELTTCALSSSLSLFESCSERSKSC